jgi:hypothetical protein
MSPVSEATRRPTRCPACKGPLIHHRTGWTQRSSSWFYCYFCKHSWKSRLGDAFDTSDGELTGEVFVVVGRKRRHACSSVAVQAIPEDALTAHLERRAAQRELKSGKLRREIDALATTLAKARAEEDRLWSIQKEDEGSLQKAKAWSVAYNNTKKITRQLEDLQTRWQQLTSGEHFLQDLPPAISTAKTNADGAFTLAVPRNGRFGIVARASGDSREREEQTYLWVVWVSLDGEAAKRLVLNNDNVVGAGSPDSALQ